MSDEEKDQDGLGALAPQITLPIAIRREWVLYAFPAGKRPTDERAIELGANELAQIVDGATRSLRLQLDLIEPKVDAAQKRIAELEDECAGLKRDLALAQMGGKAKP